MSFSYLYLRPLSPNKGVRRIYRICSFQGTPLALSSAIQVHGIHALGSLMMHLFFILAATYSPTRMQYHRPAGS